MCFDIARNAKRWEITKVVKAVNPRWDMAMHAAVPNEYVPVYYNRTQIDERCNKKDVVYKPGDVHELNDYQRARPFEGNSDSSYYVAHHGFYVYDGLERARCDMGGDATVFLDCEVSPEDFIFCDRNGRATYKKIKILGVRAQIKD